MNDAPSFLQLLSATTYIFSSAIDNLSYLVLSYISLEGWIKWLIVNLMNNCLVFNS